MHFASPFLTQFFLILISTLHLTNAAPQAPQPQDPSLTHDPKNADIACVDRSGDLDLANEWQNPSPFAARPSEEACIEAIRAMTLSVGREVDREFQFTSNRQTRGGNVIHLPGKFDYSESGQ